MPGGQNAPPRGAIISRSNWMTRASARRSTPISSTTRAAMVTPSSGPAAANPAGSKSRDEPPPGDAGRGVCVKGAVACAEYRFGSESAQQFPSQLFEKSCTKNFRLIRLSHPKAARRPSTGARADARHCTIENIEPMLIASPKRTLNSMKGFIPNPVGQPNIRRSTRRLLSGIGGRIGACGIILLISFSHHFDGNLTLDVIIGRHGEGNQTE